MKRRFFFLLPLVATAVMLALPSSLRADWQMGSVSIQSKFAANVNPSNALPEYPRPQMVREAWMNLNGLWDFTYLPSYDEEIPTSGFQQILVPYCVESALSGIKTHYESMAYRRNVTVPAEWSSKRVLLNFEAVDWRCTVYVNGEEVATHDGGYDPFSVDVTDKVKFGQQNEVAVKVFDPTDRWSVPRGKQVRSPGGIFYTACSGIWQTVWMEAVSSTYISDFHLVPDIDAATLTVKPTIGGNAENASKIKATAYHGSRKVAEAEAGAGEDIVLSIENPDLWSPDHPFLYDLKLELTDKDGKTDEVSSYFGMRKISLARDKDGFYRMMLNNEFVFQTGPLDQGYWPESNLTPPTDEAMQYDIVQMKKYGFNMVRKHLTVEPRRWYYWTDKLGLLVWQDMPSMNYGGKKDEGVTNDAAMFTPELTAMINTHYNTPSIINWVIFNEAGGQHNTKYYVDLVRSLDNTRLIDEASGWTHYGYGDIYDNHPYPAPSAPSTTRAQATADGEYGGIKYAIDGHLWKGNGWGYASVNSAEEFDSTLCNFFGKLAYYKTYKGMSAAVYTQLTDVEIEVNGLMTYDRLVKTDINKLYAANRKLIEHEGVEEEYILSPANIAPQSWRYTTDAPAEGWNKTDFDDSSWKIGNSGFGANGLANMTYGTRWNTSEIWIRKNITLDLTEEDLARLRMIIYNDEDVEVYFNGTLVYNATGYLSDYKMVDFTTAGRKAVNAQGDNQIAIHVKQTSGGQYIDFGLQLAKDAAERSVDRVVQINMDYNKSSEVSFAVGYSLDPDATEPDEVKQFTRLTFADGEANYIGINDGALLTPKTIEFDITDFVGEQPEGTKIKYFVYVKPQTSGEGEGTIYSCSVIDYIQDPAGAQTPLTLEPVEVSSETGTIMLCGAASPEEYSAPRNATLSDDGELQWDAPTVTTAQLQSYRIITGEEVVATVSKNTRTYSVADKSKAYAIVAVYSTGISEPSNEARILVPTEKTANIARHFEGNGFSVPDIFAGGQQSATVEYWFKPDTLLANSHQVGPGWGAFLITYDQMGRVTAGYDNTTTRRVQSTTSTIRKREWNHVAITLDGTRINLYVDGVWKRTMNASGYNGMPAISEFIFGSNGAYINGWIDDVRLWKTARTATEIQSDMATEIVNVGGESDLLAYYKMDEIEVGGVTMLCDCAGGHHAKYLRDAATTTAVDTTILNGEAPPMSVDFAFADTTATAGLETFATASLNSSVMAWRWSEPTTGLNKTNLQRASLIFPEAGEYEVTLTGYNAEGDSVSVAHTISVVAAELPTVDFDIYQPDRSAGAAISLLNRSAGVSTTYKWSLPGSSTDQNQTTYNASAVYPGDGVYTVTLTATNPSGSVAVSKEVEVSSGIRNMAFTVEPNVVLPSETTVFTEQCGADSANLVWTVASDKNRTLILGGTTAFTPTAVGRYDITLTDSETGSSSSVKNALYVCTARSKTGLLFRNNQETLTIPTPFKERTTKFTVEWWMKPAMTLNAGAMQTKNGVFSIATDTKGVMTATVNNKSVVSPEGFVIPNEWHHYAVTLTGSRLYLFRDGEQKALYTPILASPAWDDLQLGGEGSSMAVNIDELRIWGTGLKDNNLLAVCNNPVTDVAGQESANNLLVYYKFDDQAAMAKDETSHAAIGVMTGFQTVAGANYVNSDGVFSLSVNAPSAIEDETDITASTLTNYEAEFRHTAEAVNGSTGSYVLENGTKASTWQGDILPADEAGVYVDTQAGGNIAFTTSWGGFSPDGVDKSLYQVVTLPAGVYRFSAANAVNDNTDDCFLVATLGGELANLGGLSTTLAYAPLNTGSVTFTVPHETQVSLGVLYNMPAYSSSLISGFSLSRLSSEIMAANKDDITAVGAVVADGEDEIDVKADKGGLVLRGDGKPVRIYTIDGRLVMGITVNGAARVALPAGIYIVNSRKVQVR